MFSNDSIRMDEQDAYRKEGVQSPKRLLSFYYFKSVIFAKKAIWTHAMLKI